MCKLIHLLWSDRTFFMVERNKHVKQFNLYLDEDKIIVRVASTMQTQPKKARNQHCYLRAKDTQNC